MDQLRVINSLGTVSCDTLGNFSTACFTGEGQLTVVCTSEGNPLLMAWFSKNQSQVNSRTTAEVLLWLGLGSWMLPADARAGLRGVITAMTTELDGFAGSQWCQRN